jgi:signal transduction histidine kinase/ligand-binding sensor domain-containing protein/DNA-binding response OmpR family regulator
MNKLIIISILLLGHWTSSAANTDAYFFTNLTINNGLGSNVTNSIVQDKYGFIWIGTQEGLSRYDGYQMTQFQNEGHPTSIISNNISTLLYDDDYIWVGTWNGLSRINIRTFKVTQINTGDAKAIRALMKDQRGRIWIGTTKGILIYTAATQTYTLYNTANSALSHNTIRAFYQSKDGTIWVGTYNGLNCFHNGTFTSYNLKGTYKPLLENNLICTIHPFSANNDTLLWVGTETGLVAFDTRNGQTKTYNTSNTAISNEVIKCLYQQNDSLIWLGTDFGLNIFNRYTGKITTLYHDPQVIHSIANNVIWEIFEDQSQRVWLITSGGISIIDPSKTGYILHQAFFSYQEPRIGNQIRALLCDENNDLWMASIHGVIHKSNKTGLETYFSTNSVPERQILLDNVYALAKDTMNRIWIGTAGGINLWNPATQTMKSITANRNNGLTSNYISGFAVLDDGTMWVSAWEGGMYKITGDIRNVDKIHFLQFDNNGEARFLASKNSIYMNQANKFWKINPHTLEKDPVKTIAQHINNKHIISQLATQDGQLWLGLQNEIIRYTPATDSISSIKISTGTPVKIINLQEDSQGFIWGTTHNTILRIDPATNSYTTLPVNTNTYFRGFYNYSATINTDGVLYFGGDNGYVEVKPTAFNGPEKRPTLLISGLFINNRKIVPSDSTHVSINDIAFTDLLKLKYYENSLTFEFSTFDYLFPDVSQFRYRLTPLQDEWTFTSGIKNFAVFSNLTPGDYTLEVSGTNRLGVWSETRQLPIHIAPSLLLSKAFILLYILIAIGLTYTIFSIYNYRQKLNNQLHILKLKNEHSEKMYEAKIDFFTNISHEFRTPLSLIIPPLKQLLNQPVNPVQQKMLNLAYRNALRLYKLVNQLLDLRKIESDKLLLSTEITNMAQFCKGVFIFFDDIATRHEIDYTITLPEEPVFANIDKEKIETILFNILSNAFKYTPSGGSISLKLANDKKQHLQIAISDTGVGISGNDQQHIFEHFYQTGEKKKKLKTGSGIGLTLAHKYAQLHNGTLSVNSEIHKGSTFLLTLPACKSASEVPTDLHPFTVPSLLNQKKQSLNQATAKRILIIDDNDDILDLIRWNLQDSYYIQTAHDGNEGWDVLQKEKPQLVISDIMMPGINGLELCKMIKQEKKTMHLPVILLTAKTMDQQKLEGMQSGADMYITKPFDIEYLQSCIEAIFRRENQLSEFIKKQLLITPKNPKDEKPTADEQLLTKVMTIIENKVDDPELTVEYIATQIGMSATHLYRRLRQITGKGTKEIIIDYRLQKAALYIKNQNSNILEAMYAVGFTSQSAFSKSFKGKYGVPPSKYTLMADNKKGIPSS